MDVEKAKKFAEMQEELSVPGMTGFENLTPRQRFDNLWEQIHELSERTSSDKSLNYLTGYQNKDCIQIGTFTQEGVKLNIFITNIVEDHVVDAPEPERRKIEALWTVNGQHLPREGVADPTPISSNNPDLRQQLALLEETVEAAKYMLSEQNAQAA